MKPKEITEIIGVIAVLGSGIYTFAKFDERLDQLENRVERVEVRVDPLRQLRVGKGDLCLKLLEQWGAARDRKRQQEFEEKWSRSDCDSLPAGASVNVSDTGEAANVFMNSN
jgi:hypothetical protein